MDLHSGFPFWLAKNGLAGDYPALNSNLSNIEIAIIGSGISGALCALALGRAGFQCTMLDKRILSSGSTLASTAQLNYEIDLPLFKLNELYGEVAAAGIYRACFEAGPKMEKLLQETGLSNWLQSTCSLYLASDKNGAKENELELKAREKAAIPAKLVSANDLLETFAIKRANAIYHPFAWQFDSYQVAAGLIAYCVKHFGLQVYTRTNIVEIVAEANQVVLQTESGNTVNARHLVCATGYEASAILAKELMKINSTYALVTQPIDPEKLWMNGCQIWETSRPYMYIRTTTDNRIMMGGADEPFKDEKRRDALLEKKKDVILKSFNRLFPNLDVAADFYWCGSFAESPDGLPYIGAYPGLPNVSFALGYGGNGSSFSVIAAEMIANRLRGIPDEREALFSFTRA